MKHLRICLIGDSQLAALKLGWDLVRSDYPGTECFFFGGPGGTMLDIATDGDALAATSESAKSMIAQVSGGAARLRPSEFDAICLVGLKYRFLTCLYLLARIHTHNMVPLRRSSSLVSTSFLREAIRDLLEDTLAVRLIGMIESVSKVPLLFAPDPLPSEGRLTKGALSKWSMEELRTSIESLFEVYQYVTEQIAESKGVTLVQQPPHTISIPGLTRVEFSRGSIRLRGTLDQLHRDEDHLHMNQAYGAEMVREILKAIDPIANRSALSADIATSPDFAAKNLSPVGTAAR